jgi:hypothetical protein
MLAGIPAGRRLVGEPTALGVAEQVIAIRALLDHLGFAPQPANVAADGSHVIELHQWPFRDLVEDGLSVVCAAHRGLLQGAYEGSGGRPPIGQAHPVRITRSVQRPTPQRLEKGHVNTFGR